MSITFQKACLNVARIVPMMYVYIYDENHCLPVLEEHIDSIFCDINVDLGLGTSSSYMAPRKILPIGVSVSLKHNTNN